MRYLCVHCNESFDAQGEGRPRCPKCMRVHDIRPLQELVAARPAGRPRWLWIAPLVVTVAAGAGGGFWWHMAQRGAPADTDTVALEPLSQAACASHLKRLGVRAGELSGLLQPNDAVERFAKAATSGKQTATDKARALVQAIRERASQRAFVRWSLMEPRAQPPMVAPLVLDAIQNEGAEKHLYPLEIASLAAAALRSVGVAAMVAEAYAFSGERSPPDPSGRIGYFILAVYGGKGAAPDLFDPYGGRAQAPKTQDVEVMTDIQAIGAALSLRALSRTVRLEASQEAIADSDAALIVLPRSATARSARGAILLANGGIEQGEAEFKAAAQIRPDGPRRHNLSILSLMKGELEQAQREVSSALAEYRDYPEAHATLASLYIARSEFDLARAELEEAARLEPALPMLQPVWAQFYAAQGRSAEAIAYAERSVKTRPYDPQSHLLLAQLYHQAARYVDMRREARAALDLIPLSRKEEAKQGIERMLGSTALEEPSEPETKKENSLNLDGPLPLLPETTKLRLQDKNLRLKLNP
jgi:tetratricopeptide (TPR) repeat protein